jgi:hypothetical protein
MTVEDRSGLHTLTRWSDGARATGASIIPLGLANLVDADELASAVRLPGEW